MGFKSSNSFIGLLIWPFLRQSLWFELTGVKLCLANLPLGFRRSIYFLKSLQVFTSFTAIVFLESVIISSNVCFYLSSCLLQLLQNNIYFDSNRSSCVFYGATYYNKYYLSEWRQDQCGIQQLCWLPSPVSSLYLHKISQRLLGFWPKLRINYCLLSVFSNVVMFQRCYHYGKKFFSREQS